LAMSPDVEPGLDRVHVRQRRLVSCFSWAWVAERVEPVLALMARSATLQPFTLLADASPQPCDGTSFVSTILITFFCSDTAFVETCSG